MLKIHIDLETRSAVDLGKAGVTRYAMDASTSVLVLAYCIEGSDDVRLWTPDQPIPAVLREPYHLVAHNAAFELALIKHNLSKLGFAIPAEFTCTMIAAYQRNFPGSLEFTAKALGLGEGKDTEGRNVMLRMCKHDYVEKTKAKWHRKTKRKKDPISIEAAESGAADEMAADFDAICKYCANDVIVEKAIDHKIPMFDHELADLDRKINERGVWVDIQTATCIQSAIEKELERLDEPVEELTGGAIKSVRQVAKLALWLRENGYKGEGVAKDIIQRELDRKDDPLPANVVEVLKIRQKIGLGSVGKYAAIIRGCIPGCGRVHDLIQFRGGAQTGRYAGRRIQMQNLPRLEISDAEIEQLIFLFRKGDRDSIRYLYGDVFYAAKQLLRPMFGCPRGMVVSDFAQIEARLAAWVAGDLDTLNAFADPDRDPYREMASRIYKVPLDEVTDDQRFVGKTCCLGAQYGLGGRGFATQLTNRGVPTSDEEGKKATDAWRAANPNTRNFWYDLEARFLEALAKPGETFEVGRLLTVTGFRTAAGVVNIKITLPSGRSLRFHNVTLKKADPDDDESWDEITFIGASTERVYTYGGKLFENVIQAIANDLLNFCMLKLDAYGHEIVMHVHDEVVIQKASELDVQKIDDIMCERPWWAKSFPLKAETKYCPLKRYTK